MRNFSKIWKSGFFLEREALVFFRLYFLQLVWLRKLFSSLVRRPSVLRSAENVTFWWMYSETKGYTLYSIGVWTGRCRHDGGLVNYHWATSHHIDDQVRFFSTFLLRYLFNEMPVPIFQLKILVFGLPQTRPPLCVYSIVQHLTQESYT